MLWVCLQERTWCYGETWCEIEDKFLQEAVIEFEDKFAKKWKLQIENENPNICQNLCSSCCECYTNTDWQLLWLNEPVLTVSHMDETLQGNESAMG